MTVRTRFAPSPTGYLHIGGVRTALFCWLFARRCGGQFILRIDDTDQQRNVQEALQPILNGLRWLGLDWDEGPDVGGPYAPYYQSQRFDRYQAAVEKLLDGGYAYYDYATPEELKAEREAAQRDKGSSVYSRRWMAETADKRARFEAEGRKAVVRLKMRREGKLVLHDLIRGDVEFDWAQEQDHVIQRADGSCLYHLASVVDDHDLAITHVIRAEEHLSNTPRQVFIIESLGYELPQYAHLPFVAEPGSKTKLSKRKLDKYLKNRDFAELMEHGRKIAEQLQLTTDRDTFNPVITDFYQQVGYLPEALVNYLALLGWSLDDKTEHFTRQELIDSFSLERVNKAPASFDPKKLQAFQQWHMMQQPLERRVEMVLPYLERVGLVGQPANDEEREKTHAILAAAGDRVKVAGDILDYSYFFQPDDKVHPDKATLKKRLNVATLPHIVRYRDALARIEQFDAPAVAQVFRKETRGMFRDYRSRGSIGAGEIIGTDYLTDALVSDVESIGTTLIDSSRYEQSVHDFIQSEGIKIGDIIHVIRLAITGTTIGFSLYDTMAILGQECCLKRISRVISRPDAISSDSTLDLFTSLPEAMQPVYDGLDTGSEILQYGGALQLHYQGERLEGEGNICLKWHPGPEMQFEMTLAQPRVRLGFGSAVGKLYVGGRSCPIDVVVSRLSMGSKPTSIGGHLAQMLQAGDREGLQWLVFHLPNFHDWRGAPIHFNRSMWAGRGIFEAEGWQLTVDSLPEVKRRIHEAKRERGYRITHVARLERSDGRTFAADDKILNAIYYFLSFARGFWVSPILPVGFEGDGQAKWREWTPRRTSHWNSVLSWFPVYHIDDANTAFRGFLRRWTQPAQREILCTAIYWYVNANASSAGLEQRIVSGYIALELLSSVVLREIEHHTEADAADIRTVTQRIESCLLRLGALVDIPSEMDDLKQFAAGVDISSGAAVLHRMRHSILHPENELLNAGASGRTSAESLWDAFRLCLWYVEVCLLWFLGYEGRYQNRVKIGGFVGQVDQVPWSVTGQGVSPRALSGNEISPHTQGTDNEIGKP